MAATGYRLLRLSVLQVRVAHRAGPGGVSPLGGDPRGLRGVRDRQGAGLQGELQALRLSLHLQTQAAVLRQVQQRVGANTAKLNSFLSNYLSFAVT